MVLKPLDPVLERLNVWVTNVLMNGKRRNYQRNWEPVVRRLAEDGYVPVLYYLQSGWVAEFHRQEVKAYASDADLGTAVLRAAAEVLEFRLMYERYAGALGVSELIPEHRWNTAGTYVPRASKPMTEDGKLPVINSTGLRKIGE